MANFAPLERHMVDCLDRFVETQRLEPPFLDVGCGARLIVPGGRRLLAVRDNPREGRGTTTSTATLVAGRSTAWVPGPRTSDARR
jgi:hypothetical protein